MNVCFFTVCGGGEDYEFLLGSIWHHAMMGRHVVLDTTPEPDARTFKNLPPTVRWVHEPNYGRGWKEFKLRSAVERALALAREDEDADVVAYLDSDEFFDPSSAAWAFPLACDFMVEVKTVTWLPDGPRDFGESEWHRRLWPKSMDVHILRNESWIGHPDYNGNPEHHPIAQPPFLDQIMRVHGPLHHHLHYAIGEKRSQVETAQATIQGWKDGGTPVPPSPWPELLELWRDQGEKPSQLFR